MKLARGGPVWPQAAVPAAPAHSLVRHAPPAALAAAFVFCLLALTVFARFGVRISADFSISFGMVGTYVLLAALLWTGLARLNPAGGLLVAAVILISSLSLWVNMNWAPWRRQVSLNSWALLVMLYTPFALTLPASRDGKAMWNWVLHAFQAAFITVAAFGIAQYFVQFGYRAPWVIDYTPLIPEFIRGSGQYNTSNTTGTAFKSNGFFLREPSTLSFYTALALVLEWSLFRRTWALVVLALGLIVSYSGSGIAVLLVAMIVPLGFKTLLRAGAAALAVVVLYLVAGDALNLNYTFNRVHEFGSDRSSAYCRFILPGKTALGDIDEQPWVSLLGHGPGTMQKLTGSCETTYGKMLFEYGMLGTLAFSLLILYAVRKPWVPLRAQAGLLVFWFLLGGQLLGPDALLTIFLLCAIWPRTEGGPSDGAPTRNHS